MPRTYFFVALIGLWLTVPPAASAAGPSLALERTVTAFVAARDAGDADKAAQAATEALALGRLEYGENHPSQSYLLEALAGLYADEDRWKEAEDTLRQALAIREAAFGPWHTSLSTLLEGLADAALMLGRDAEAEPLFRRALAIRERHLGPDHPDIAMTLDDLAVLYSELGRDADAEGLAARSERILALYDDGKFVTAAGDKVSERPSVAALPDISNKNIQAVKPAQAKKRQAADSLMDSLSRSSKLSSTAPAERPACGDVADSVPGWCESAASPSRRPPTVERFPTVEAPGTAVVGVSFAVVVSLTEDAITPEVKVRAGPDTATTEGGGLRLPAAGGLKGDPYEAVLSAPGFEVEGSNIATIVLPREGDSTPALFKLTAEPIEGSHRPRKLFVTLWRNGAYVAKLTRQITVASSAVIADAGSSASDADIESLADFDTAAGGGSEGEAAVSVSLDEGWQSPDLTLYLFAPDGDGTLGEIIVQSPHLQVSRHAYQVPESLGDWLDGQYAAMMRAATDPDADRRRDRSVAFMRGFGTKLWREFAPSPVKEAFWRLRDKLGNEFASIQIYTDDPSLPWELMRPSRGGSEPLDFLGVGFRLARWHVSDSGDQLGRPPQALAMRNLLAVMPEYSGSDRLPAQEDEMAALESIAGFQRVAGDYDTFAGLIADMPDGLVHFSGHGSVQSASGGADEYAILLSDGALDLTTWRGLAAHRASGRALFFFNACDVGRAGRVAGFVDGWAPAVLESGASGYIGGLWPLSDSGAYDFAATFYTTLEGELRRNPAYLADMLRSARARFYQTGDPTYLAYGFYGDVNLRLDRDWAAAL